MFFKKIAYLMIGCLTAMSLQARENVTNPNKTTSTTTTSTQQSLAAGCNAPEAGFVMKVNNVEAQIWDGGDMWWDLQGAAHYEVPSGGGVHSMFASAIWVGGVDAGGQLKVAAQTYRQRGTDFWTGPLDGNASITSEECDAWDQMFVVNRDEIDQFKKDFQDGSIDQPIPQSILEWPAKGNPNISLDNKYNNRQISLAPFHDEDSNGIYEPSKGDYPILEGNEEASPDQLIWWVYNDKGDIHGNSQAPPLGMEIQATAFAFKTNDEINNMTFYSYKLINRSSNTIDSTFVAQWVDPDLGCYSDDYVGCDTSANLGICYNGDAFDETCAGSGPYGEEIPMVGVDFFEGPERTIEVVDSIDSEGDTAFVDSSIELGMSNFLYYNNDFTVIGNPESASDYYGYMTGTWKDGRPFTCGGNGYGGNKRCDYMFPSDPTNSEGWSECAEGNTPSDRRFLQSSGPFQLKPGAINDVTIGVVWVPNQNYPCPSFEEIKRADRKAQALFENNFQLIEGPDAPNVDIRELNEKVILSLKNDGANHNNVNESYRAVDPAMRPEIEQLIEDSSVTGVTGADSFYTFQGYKLYQVKDQSVSVTQLDDPDKARLIAQVDRKDTVKQLVNWSENTEVEAMVPEVKVDGNNEGIQHTFKITSDAFGKGLVNHQTYYFMVLAYAANQFREFTPNDTLPGQDIEYLEGIRNVKTYSAIPHVPDQQFGGTRLNAKYGDAPQLKRIEGSGNGSQRLELTEDSRETILKNNFMKNPVYKEGQGPVKVMIYDPLKVPDAKFKLAVKDSAATSAMVDTTPGYPVNKSSFWKLTNETTGETVTSNRTMSGTYEQLIDKWGFLVDLSQVSRVSENENSRGFLSASISYEEPLNTWLGGIPDQEEVSPLNWIRSGDYVASSQDPSDSAKFVDFLGVDPDEAYEEILEGSWAPYRLANDDSMAFEGALELLAPATSIGHKQSSLDSLASVDIVLTSDKSKWSKCVVVEAHPDRSKSQGGAIMHLLRKHPSLKKNGSYRVAIDSGRSWFPGYAINVETGERLNIMFAEDSWLKQGNGGDMIWNPNSNISNLGDPVYGGKHYVYVMRSRYDQCEDIYNKLKYASNTSNIDQLRKDSIAAVYRKAMWVGIPLLNSGYELKSVKNGIIPNKTTIKLRVAKPYSKFIVEDRNNNLPLYEFSTSDFAVDTGVTEIAKNALDSIRVVPNPYYSFSGYETGRLDNEVKITNLPSNATVSIYTVKGNMIRQFQRAVGTNTSSAEDGIDNTLAWDLTNQKGIPIASGVYLIHVKAPGLGERIIKWFGVKRPADLDTF